VSDVQRVVGRATASSLAPENMPPSSADPFDALRREARAVLGPADEEAFVAYVADRVDPSDDLRAALARLHVRDLAFAFMLSGRRDGAVEAFERTYVPALVAAARRAAPGVDPSDILQELRIHLLVGGASPPRIGEYRGEGPLRAWLRVVVLRLALNRATRAPRELPVEDALLARDRIKRAIETELRDRLGLSASEAEVLVRTSMEAVDSPIARLLVAHR